MKKLLLGTILLGLAIVVPIPTMAAVDIHIRIPLPPPILFAAPPQVIVLPETEVYVVPDILEDIFFYDGWWWRPWEGRWYRSRRYNSGWLYYPRVPSFYVTIFPNWRDAYREHRWGGGVWDHRYIRYDDLRRNWRTWQRTRYWEQEKYRQYTHHRDGKPYATERGKGELNKGKLEGTTREKGELNKGKSEGTTGEKGELNKGKLEGTTGEKGELNKGRLEGTTREKGELNKGKLEGREGRETPAQTNQGRERERSR